MRQSCRRVSAAEHVSRSPGSAARLTGDAVGIVRDCEGVWRAGVIARHLDNAALPR